MSFTFLVVNNRWTMVIKEWSCTKNSADLDEKSDNYNQPKGRKCTWKGRMFRKICLLVFRKARDNFWTKSIEKINDYRNLFVRYIQVCIYIYIDVIQGKNKNKQHFNKNISATAPQKKCLYNFIISVANNVWFWSSISFFSSCLNLSIWSCGKFHYTANMYLFKVNSENTRKMCEICTSLITLFTCLLWTYFTLFCSVSIVDFEQVNVCWVFYVKNSHGTKENQNWIKVI